jgi:membrane protein DedA with SNARE-associated domain
MLGALVAEPGQVDAGEQGLSSAEQHRGHGQVHLVHQALAQTLPYCRQQHPEATDTRDVLRAKRDRRAELPGARDRRGGLAIDFCALAIRMVREEPRSTLCSRTASFAGVGERCAERDEPIPIGTDPPRWPGGEAQRVSAVLTVVVQHGEIVLFLYVLADQLGVPIPAAPVLMTAGGLAAAGRLSLPGAVGLGVLATLVADLTWYTVGRVRGARVLGLLCRVSLEPDSCVRRTEDVFLRHGVRFLLFAKFIPGLGTVGPPLAGMVGVGVLRFSLYSATGAFLWAGAWMVLGYGAGQAVERVVTRAGLLGAAVAVTLGLVIVGYVVVKWIQRQRFLRSLRIARISPDELKGQLDAGDKPLIVDLRSAVDVGLTRYALPGAVRLAAEDLEHGRVELPRDRDVVLYCS